MSSTATFAPDDRARQRRLHRVPSASQLKGHRYRELPSVEFRGLDWVTPQFSNRFIKANAPEKLRGLRAESLACSPVVLDGITQDIADFLLHGVAVASGAALQPALDRVFQVANNHLSHADLP